MSWTDWLGKMMEDQTMQAGMIIDLEDGEVLANYPEEGDDCFTVRIILYITIVQSI